MIETVPTIHDVVLAVIPLSLVLGFIVSLALSIPATVGIVGGSVTASGLLGYTLFIDPPTSV